MANNSEMYTRSGINRTSVKYNSVRNERISVSDAASIAAERIGEAVAERNRRARIERANAPVIVKKRVKASPFPISFLFYALVMTVMLMFIAYSNSVVNEISYDIGDLEAQISDIKAENEKLSVEIEKKYDLKYIEEVATTKLGLVKSTDVVKHYISIAADDEVVVSDKATQPAAKLGATFDSLKSSLSKIYK